MTSIIPLVSHFSLWPFFLMYARVLGAIAICPLFSNDFLNNFLRACLAFVLTVVVAAGYYDAPLSDSLLTKILLLVSNVAYGSLIGYFLSLPIWLVESCGNIIDTQRGEQMGAMLNKLTGTQASSIGKLMAKAFITYLVVNNGLLFFIDTVYGSFKLVPLNHLLPVISLHNIDNYISIFASYLYWVAVLVLPLIAVMLLVDIILGLISTFIPQLNVTIIAMPIKSVVALLILSIYIGSLFHNVFIQFVVHVRQVSL